MRRVAIEDRPIEPPAHKLGRGVTSGTAEFGIARSLTPFPPGQRRAVSPRRILAKDGRTANVQSQGEPGR